MKESLCVCVNRQLKWSLKFNETRGYNTYSGNGTNGWVCWPRCS